MNNYNPEHAPGAAEWLATDEKERIRLCERYHRLAGLKMPSVKAHAAFHAVVENQIAENLEPIVRTMARLIGEGLSRHDAVHALASVAAKHVYEMLSTKSQRGSTTLAHERFYTDIERLTAKNWREDE